MAALMGVGNPIVDQMALNPSKLLRSYTPSIWIRFQDITLLHHERGLIEVLNNYRDFFVTLQRRET